MKFCCFCLLSCHYWYTCNFTDTFSSVKIVLLQYIIQLLSSLMFAICVYCNWERKKVLRLHINTTMQLLSLNRTLQTITPFTWTKDLSKLHMPKQSLENKIHPANLHCLQKSMSSNLVLEKEYGWKTGAHIKSSYCWWDAWRQPISLSR